jgi:hypothetical protein
MASTNPPLKFDLPAPSEPPKRTASGAPVKLWLIKAMAEQHELMKKAHAGADKLVDVAREIDSLPPSTNGGRKPGDEE